MTSVSSIKSTATAVPSPSLSTCLSENYSQHEAKFTVKPAIKGLAKRIIHRLTVYRLLDGFTELELFEILDSMIELIEPAPAFVEMSAPVVIFGDTHGQFNDLMRMFSYVGMPPKTRLLFLGDYVDRCRRSIEIVILLFCFKLLYPTHVQILRGNHECAKMNRLYGFYEECRRTQSVLFWKKMQSVFNELPLCCRVQEKLICMHGGISPDIKSLDTLYKLKKPRTHNECDMGIALDLMWSDPATGADACCAWQFNKMRNASWMFGNQSVKEFNAAINVDLVVRAHELCKFGHLFYCDKMLVTIFSAPNYCGTDGNCASCMKIGADLKISFVTLKPILDKSKLSMEKLAELEKQSKNVDVKSPNPIGTLFNKAEEIKDVVSPPPAAESGSTLSATSTSSSGSSTTASTTATSSTAGSSSGTSSSGTSTTTASTSETSGTTSTTATITTAIAAITAPPSSNPEQKT